MNSDSPFIGTAAFASPNSHMGYELSRRDDLISLGYLIYYVYNGSLPWIGLSDPQSARCTEVAKNKAQFSTTVDSKTAPDVFRVYLDYSLKLGFEEEPDYEWLLSLIE